MSPLLSVAQIKKAESGGGVHGANELAQLLLQAKDDVIPKILVKVFSNDSAFKNSPDVAARYGEVRIMMFFDVPKFQFKMTNEILKDSKNGYETWIAVQPAHGIIFYNPVAYDKLVGTKPDIWFVTERLLHELGHYYGFDEDGSWVFAKTLIRAYRAIEAVPPQTQPAPSAPPAQAAPQPPPVTVISTTCECEYLDTYNRALVQVKYLSDGRNIRTRLGIYAAQGYSGTKCVKIQQTSPACR